MSTTPTWTTEQRKAIGGDLVIKQLRAEMDAEADRRAQRKAESAARAAEARARNAARVAAAHAYAMAQEWHPPVKRRERKVKARPLRG